MHIPVKMFVAALLSLSVLSLSVYAQKRTQNSSPPTTRTESKPRDVTTEEKLVRLAYRKLEVYGAAESYRKRLNGQSGGEPLRITLNNFKSGPIEEIRSRLYTAAVTQPTKEVIQIGKGTIQENDGEPQVAYSANWVAGDYARAFDRNWTVGEALDIQVAQYHDVRHYASFDVSVSLDKKTRSYSALALFHGTIEDLRLEFWDLILGMGGTVTTAWEDRGIPFGLQKRPADGREPETFKEKIAAYLDRPSGAGDPFSCESRSDGVECCVTEDLADFWGVEKCGKRQSVKGVPRSRADLVERDIQFYDSDDTGHYSGTGVHHGRARFRPSCTELPSNRQSCDVEIRDEGYGDTDSNHSDIYWHRGGIARSVRGNQGPRGQNIECDSSVGFAFDYCVFPSCNVNLTLSVTGQGTGASATITGGNLWRTARAQGNVCNLPASSQGPGGCNQSAADGCLPGFVEVGGICTRSASFVSQCMRFGDYDPASCACTGGCADGGCSPIVVDVLGNGFSMTNAQSGVFFDIEGRGVPSLISWTAPNSDDAWLALDRDNNGVIDSGKELFGNITAQDIHPEGIERNGFLALALYDSPGYGGNGDGLITELDSIFSQLRLWRDDNHNGVSEDCELFTLPALALTRLELNYKTAHRVDEYGNQFKFRAKADGTRESSIGRWAWDVYLVRQQ